MKRFFQPDAAGHGRPADEIGALGVDSRARSSAAALDAHTDTYIHAASTRALPETDTPLSAPTIVRIAVYDSMRAAPRIEEVYGDSPLELIERLSARVYQVAREAGGSVAYIVIRELAENLVHAGFADVVVSVMEDGHVIRFSDSGPGIADVDRAMRPGFTTATADMRRYIRGVGSGLPIAGETMVFSGGSLSVDENLSGGAVVTVTAAAPEPAPVGNVLVQPLGGVLRGLGEEEPRTVPLPHPAPMARPLSDRQKQTLLLVMEIGSAGPTTVSRELGVALSTAHRDLAFLEDEGLITGDAVGKRKLTPLGVSYVESLF